MISRVVLWQPQLSRQDRIGVFCRAGDRRLELELESAMVPEGDLGGMACGEASALLTCKPTCTLLS